MIFALIIFAALMVAALVLFLEHLGDPQKLESEYGLKPSMKEKQR